MANIEAGRRWPFPVFSTKRGRCAEPEAIVDGHRYCARARNNVLFVGHVPEIPGWRRVGCRARWNHIDGAWRPHDLSLQRVADHRWWGTRHHIRIWLGKDHAIGQAHAEDWQGIWPRRHRVVGLDAALDSIRSAVGGRITEVERTRVLMVGGSQ